MQQWEYIHLYVEACQVKEITGFGVQTQVSEYPAGVIQQKLNSAGAAGWELISMEPNWFYERVGISMAMEVTRPKAIIGYWFTFKRPAGQQSQGW